MRRAVVFDCEFLTAEGAPRRFWCGPFDPDPTLVQIGAVALGLEGDFPLVETRSILVMPVDRHGRRPALDPHFTALTGIDEAALDAAGVPLAEGLAAFDRFSDGAPLWSWGKDELNAVAVSCYVAGIPPTIPASRFGNATRLVLKAGMPHADVVKTRSADLAAYFGVEHPPLRAHDALDDALSVAYALQHLLRAGRLAPADLVEIGRAP